MDNQEQAQKSFEGISITIPMHCVKGGTMNLPKPYCHTFVSYLFDCKAWVD